MDLTSVCAATGIEPSRIRYFEREFRDFLASPAGPAAADAYDDRAVSLFAQIEHWMYAEGRTVFDVRQELARGAQAPGELLRIIAVTSGKGGVGKTTVSLNLAIALAARGRRTLLIDADMGLGNVHVLAGIQPNGTLLDVVERRATIDEILTPGPAGIQVLCGASGVPELADLDQRKLDPLLEGLARLGGRFDTIVVDTAAGIAAQVTRVLRMADDIVVVTTPNIAATLDAYGVIKVACDIGMPGRLHIIVNQVSSNRQALTVYERLRDCAERFLRCTPAHLGSLQKHGSVERANQSRRPLMLDAPQSLNVRRLQEMADALLAAPVARTREAVHSLPLDLFVRGLTAGVRRAG